MFHFPSKNRFFINDSFNGIVFNTLTIFSLVLPSPYGFFKLLSDGRNVELRALVIARRIPAFLHGATSITFFARTLPRWRSPMLTTGNLNDGASINPLEEFPTMTSADLNNDKYRNCPREANTLPFSGDRKSTRL